MRSAKPLRAAKAGCIVLSLLFCALGALMLALPALSITLIGVAAGVMLIAFGLVKLSGYFSGDLYQLAFQHDLGFGALLMVLGILILVNPDHAMRFLCLILGIAFAADGLMKVQTAMDARRFGLKSWWLILLLGAVDALVGFAAALRPAQSAHVLTMLLGASMVAEGLLNLGVTLCAVKIIRKPSVDAEFEED